MAAKARLVLSAQAQGHFVPGAGARLPIGPARPRVEMVEIVEMRGDNRKERLTPLGYSTARIRLPRALSLLEGKDARLQAALRYRHLVEKIGAVGGSGGLIEGGAGRVSDGGAVYRTAIAQELRDFVGKLGGMALVKGSSSGERRDIPVRPLVDAVVLEGVEIKGVLRRHGWSGKGLFVKTLTDALYAALTSMADVQERY
jgi:hypothetical protein